MRLRKRVAALESESRAEEMFTQTLAARIARLREDVTRFEQSLAARERCELCGAPADRYGWIDTSRAGRVWVCTEHLPDVRVVSDSEIVETRLEAGGISKVIWPRGGAA